MNRFTSQPDSSGLDNLTNQHLPEHFVDADNAAQYLCCSRKHLLRLSIQGKVPAHPLPGSGTRRTWRYLLSELHDWMLSNGGNHSEKAGSNRTINGGSPRKGAV